MPELPEVETTRRGIVPHILGRRLAGARVRQPRLRYQVPDDLDRAIRGLTVTDVARRGKYLLLQTAGGTLLVHLGMSGSLRVLPEATPAGPHDHVDILFAGACLRLRDPRRFGMVLWTPDPPDQHPLLRNLGPEPLGPDFSGAYLHGRAKGRKCAIKNLIMDSHTVVGVGNIYASEALFKAGILPTRAAGRIAKPRIERLVRAIKTVLGHAVEQGGTTLRDFVREDGKPGYFRNELHVYGRAGEPCTACGAAIKSRIIGQRNSFYCSRCQR